MVFSVWSVPKNYKRELTVALANNKPVLSSEIVPHINKPETV
jgi:hypothetical protein